MARASAVDPCMFCQEAPCVCAGTKKPVKKAAPKAAPAKEVLPELATKTVEEPAAPPVERKSMVDRMRARAAAAPPAPVVQVRERARPVVRELPTLSAEDAAVVAAVRLIDDVIGVNPDDLAPFKRYLDKPPTVAERSAAWRAQRRGSETPPTATT